MSETIAGSREPLAGTLDILGQAAIALNTPVGLWETQAGGTLAPGADVHDVRDRFPNGSTPHRPHARGLDHFDATPCTAQAARVPGTGGSTSSAV